MFPLNVCDYSFQLNHSFPDVFHVFGRPVPRARLVVFQDAELAGPQHFPLHLKTFTVRLAPRQ
jgi:hypothetical protein